MILSQTTALGFFYCAILMLLNLIPKAEGSKQHNRVFSKFNLADCQIWQADFLFLFLEFFRILGSVKRK